MLQYSGCYGCLVFTGSPRNRGGYWRRHPCCHSGGARTPPTHDNAAVDGRHCNCRGPTRGKGTPIARSGSLHRHSRISRIAKSRGGGRKALVRTTRRGYEHFYRLSRLRARRRRGIEGARSRDIPLAQKTLKEVPNRSAVPLDLRTCGSAKAELNDRHPRSVDVYISVIQTVNISLIDQARSLVSVSARATYWALVEASPKKLR
jgi:hypothetical protein